MRTAAKHYKIINSITGYAIYYYTLNDDLSADSIKEELEKVRVHVAIQNDMFLGSLYWEEIRDEDNN